jgi:spermidine synthase
MNQNPATQPAWLELPAGILSEEGVIRVLEPTDSDAGRLHDDIIAGRYVKPFILDDGRVRRLNFTLRLVQNMRIARLPVRRPALNQRVADFPGTWHKP